MSTVLVTGATGFVGPHAVAALRERGADVTAAGRAEADLLDAGGADALVRRVRARPTHLLHLAWYAEHGYWTSTENLRWVEATVRLVRSFADAGGRRVVVASTGAVYAPEAGVCDEESSPRRPSTLYGAAKLATADVLRAAAGTLGLEVVEARLFQLYGPGEDERRLVPTVIRCLLRGEEAPATQGTQQRDFLHVADAGRALAALVGSDVTGAVNIGSGTPTAVRDVVLALGRLTGRGDLVRLGAVPMRPDEPPLLVADVGRLRDKVGWTPALDIDAGLAATVAWWKEQAA